MRGCVAHFLYAQVFTRPAIGKYTTLEEPKARESLLTPTMRHSTSRASLTSSPTDSPIQAQPASPGAPSAPAALSTSPSSTLSATDVDAAGELSPMPSMFQAAATAAALMERTPFAIDDARDDEDSSEDETEDGDEDDDVMDEVDAFLEAHDSGLTEAERELAQGASLFSIRPSCVGGGMIADDLCRGGRFDPCGTCEVERGDGLGRVIRWSRRFGSHARARVQLSIRPSVVFGRSNASHTLTWS